MVFVIFLRGFLRIAMFLVNLNVVLISRKKE